MGVSLWPGAALGLSVRQHPVIGPRVRGLETESQQDWVACWVAGVSILAVPPAPRSQALPCLVLLLLLGTEAGDPAKCAPPLTALPAPPRPAFTQSFFRPWSPTRHCHQVLSLGTCLSSAKFFFAGGDLEKAESRCQLLPAVADSMSPRHPDRVLGPPTLGRAAARPGSLHAPAGAGPRQSTPGPPAGAGCANLGRHSVQQAQGGNRARGAVGHSERVPERQRLVPALRAAGTLCNRDLASQFQQLWTGSWAAREKITVSSHTEKVY